MCIEGCGLRSHQNARGSKKKFQECQIPPREQIDPRFKEDIAVLHLAGISNRVMAMISKRILGVEVSTDTVTKSLSSVEDKALDWLDRPLEKKYWALFWMEQILKCNDVKVPRRSQRWSYLALMTRTE
ncbi:MAG: transposase [Bdellovibrionales bacterium]|nr:transposase [Bdellovibrionales bacterium]